jgi:hypothetical protein
MGSERLAWVKCALSVCVEHPLQFDVLVGAVGLLRNRVDGDISGGTLTNGDLLALVKVDCGVDGRELDAARWLGLCDREHRPARVTNPDFLRDRRTSQDIAERHLDRLAIVPTSLVRRDVNARNWRAPRSRGQKDGVFAAIRPESEQGCKSADSGGVEHKWDRKAFARSKSATDKGVRRREKAHTQVDGVVSTGDVLVWLLGVFASDGSVLPGKAGERQGAVADVLH